MQAKQRAGKGGGGQVMTEEIVHGRENRAEMKMCD